MELFLDANAHTQLNQKAAKEYIDFCNSPAGHGHPSSPSVPGRLAAAAMERARLKIASLLGAEKPDQILFTDSCTQAAGWAADIFIDLPGENKKISPLEHPSVRDSISYFANFLKINSDGVVDDDRFFDAVCCIHVQNEIGTIQPIKRFDCEWLYSDISQSLGKIPVDVQNLDLFMGIAGGHKFGGPSGVGFLYLRDTKFWQPFGKGSRYFLDRPGTPNVAGIVATAVALEEAISTLESRTEKACEFQTTIENRFQQMGIDVIGKNVPRVPHTTFIKLPQLGLLTLVGLGEENIHVGLGSACGSIHTGNSPLMEKLGHCGGVHDFMRISQWGEYGEKEAKHFLQVFEKVLVRT